MRFLPLEATISVIFRIALSQVTFHIARDRDRDREIEDVYVLAASELSPNHLGISICAPGTLLVAKKLKGPENSVLYKCCE